MILKELKNFSFYINEVIKKQVGVSSWARYKSGILYVCS